MGGVTEHGSDKTTVAPGPHGTLAISNPILQHVADRDAVRVWGATAVMEHPKSTHRAKTLDMI
jgi:hypothetical protein